MPILTLSSRIFGALPMCLSRTIGCSFWSIDHGTPSGRGWLHTKRTLNYSYRGLWGSCAGVLVMFVVSSFAKKTDPAALEQLTVSWKLQKEKFRGLLDWRLQSRSGAFQDTGS
jgi:hypothetical protein